MKELGKKYTLNSALTIHINELLIAPPLVTTDYVSKNLDNITLVDSTWYLPSLNKDAFEEFQLERLPVSSNSTLYIF
jgi:hypothetical protein